MKLSKSKVNDFINCVGLLRLLYKNVTLTRYETITAFVGTYSCLRGKGKEMRKENIHSVDTQNLIVKLVDSGIQFNPLEKEDPDITLSAEERQVGGLGIFLCKQMMDDLRYVYENGCNNLFMTKRLS